MAGAQFKQNHPKFVKLTCAVTQREQSGIVGDA